MADLLKMGCSVLETHQLGDDKPDLIVGWHGVTALVEIKPAGRAYTPDRREKDRAARQAAYLASWQGGPAFMATTTEEIVVRLTSPSHGRGDRPG